MYTEEELRGVRSRLTRRWLAVAVPCGAMLLAAIALFIIGRQNRSDTMWMLTAALTVLGGALFLFFYGVYIRPMRLYAKHIDMMLNGRKRETTGVFKTFSDDVSDKEGLDCHAMLINVGDKGDDEDDRLFYYDAHKDRPDIPLGTRITVVSNDKMVAEIKLA